MENLVAPHKNPSFEELKNFYSGKRVFITGHSGFKGSWMCAALKLMNAKVCGYSLEPPTDPSLFVEANIEDGIKSVVGDVRDLASLRKTFEDFRPEIVFHLAAQPIVRESYKKPVLTYETNVMGTVNLLECVRENISGSNPSVLSVLNVTTDKVYLNREWVWGYRENEMLDGFDPYSNSKSCSELVTHSYKNSFFSDLPVSTARAGNVIGGGDFAIDRIIPDCVRAAAEKTVMKIRNPYSTRPYQHVLEPVFAYLMIAARQVAKPDLQGWYNVGPDAQDIRHTGELVEEFSRCWGEGFSYKVDSEKNAPHEANFLTLDCSKLKSNFGWTPRWDVETAIAQTVEWSKRWLEGGDVQTCMDDQILSFGDTQ